MAGEEEAEATGVPVVREVDMKYMILVESDIDDLEDAVKMLMQDGWKPQGGVAVICSDKVEAMRYHQAMTKDE